MDSAERKQYLTVGAEMDPDFRSPLIEQNYSQTIPEIPHSDISKLRRRQSSQKARSRRQKHQINLAYDLILEELYPSSQIYSIYALIIFLNMLINFDHGSIPAATSQIKKDLRLDNFSLGVLGSVVYLGLTFGSLVAPVVFSIFSQKAILIGSFGLNTASLALFTQVEEFWVLCLVRFMVGFCHIFVCIYFPVWVDTFGFKERKTIMLSTLLLSVPMGIVMGYSFTGYLVQEQDWRLSFYCQLLVMVPALLLLLLVPVRYLKIEEALDVQHNERQKLKKGGQGQTGGTEDLDHSEIRNSKTSQRNVTPFQIDSVSQQKEVEDRLGQTAELFADEVFLRRKKRVISQDYAPLYSYHTIQHERIFGEVADLERHVHIEPFDIVCSILSNPAFVFLTLTLSSLYFLMNGVSFWITDYLIVVLRVKSSEVYVYFAVTCVTAPMLGILSGGVIIHRSGGYTSDSAIRICLAIGALATVSALIVPFITYFPVLQVVLWLLMFFGSFILPILTGILIQIVNPHERTIASSISNLFYNLLGYLPSPFVYGLVTELSGGDDSRMGMVVLMFSSIFSFLFLTITYYIRQDQAIQQQAILKTKKGHTISYSNVGYENLLIYESLNKEQLISLKKLESFKFNEVNLQNISLDQRDRIGEVVNEEDSYAQESDRDSYNNLINRDELIKDQEYEDEEDSFDEVEQQKYFLPRMQEAIVRIELARKSSLFEPIARLHTIF